jgi:choline dehydrogenase
MPAGFTRVVQRRALNWGYASEPEPALGGRVVPVPRGRVLGGSSSINGMFHIRGDRRDFDDWAAAGCTGWGYADVLPYFVRSESNWRGAGPFHGGDGPLQVRAIDERHLLAEPLRAAAREAGHHVNEDYDGARHDGIARGDVAIDRRGRRHSSARAYLRPVRGRANLQVWTRALTRRVLVEDGRAVGVELERGGRVWRVRARTCV